MASLAIALTTCCFFLCSLATPCLDDEVAMFQSDVRMLSTASTDVKSMQDDMAVSAEKLADIDKTLVNLTKFVEDMAVEIESGPEWMKRAELMSFQFIVPMMEALDAVVVKADRDMANMSFDWVETAFAGEGSPNDWLHTASSIISGSNMLKKVAGKKPNKLAGVQDHKLLKAGVKLADTAVNGVQELGDGAKWVAGDAMAKMLRNMAERLTEAAEGIDAATKLMGIKLTSMAEQLSMSAKIQESVAKVPDSLKKLREDSLHAFHVFTEKFETKFDDLPATKKHRVTRAVKAVQKTQKAVQKTAKTLNTAKALFSGMAKGMARHSLYR